MRQDFKILNCKISREYGKMPFHLEITPTVGLS